MFTIFNDNCVDINQRIPDSSVDLGIYDPPFGLGESTFDKHYNRDSDNIIKGYTEAPEDYDNWTYQWMSESKRVLKDNGSMYIFMGHSNLRSILNAAHKLELHEINHIIWKYNFGVNTKRKFVTSHYHVLYYSKSSKAKPTFNTNCRFGCQEKDDNGKSLLYNDLEDVFIINKEYAPGEKKNQNKLPEEIIKKLILYSSNQGDMVCDFFMGNFTTAYSALKLGRNVTGYEINKNSYDYHINKIKDIIFGCELPLLRKFENLIPENQGKTITTEEARSICQDYLSMIKNGTKIKEAYSSLQSKYGRGRFSIKNILDKNLPAYT